MPELTTQPKTGGFGTSIGGHPVAYAAFAIVGAGVLLFLLIIVPTVRSLQPGGSASLSDAHARLTAAREDLADEGALVDAAIAVSADDKARIGMSAPGEADVPGIVVQIGALARTAGVSFQGIDLTVPIAAEVPTGFKALDIALNLGNASYDRAKLFLRAIESNLRLLDVRSFTISPASRSANMELRAYFVDTK